MAIESTGIDGLLNYSSDNIQKTKQGIKTMNDTQVQNRAFLPAASGMDGHVQVTTRHYY